MGYLSTFFLTALLFAAAGCTSNVNKLSSMKKKGYAYSRALSKEYETLARQEGEVYNQDIDADHFAVKGIQAASGLEVLPEDPEAWSCTLDEKEREELMEARERLIFGLYKSGTIIDPENAARSVALYDCWIEEASESCSCAKRVRKCKWQFYKTLHNMEKNVRDVAPTFMIWYHLHDARIARQGKEEIDQISKVLKHLRNHKLLIHCMGDPVGGRATNLTLSQKRANNLKAALIKEGVPRDRIEDAVGVGEKGAAETDPYYRRCDVHLR